MGSKGSLLCCMGADRVAAAAAFMVRLQLACRMIHSRPTLQPASSDVLCVDSGLPHPHPPCQAGTLLSVLRAACARWEWPIAPMEEPPGSWLASSGGLSAGRQSGGDLFACDAQLGCRPTAPCQTPACSHPHPERLLAISRPCSLLDPPRPDSAETIELAKSLGVEVKMVTGDQHAIAVETSRRLGMGTNIMEGAELLQEKGSAELGDKVGLGGCHRGWRGWAGAAHWLAGCGVCQDAWLLWDWCRRFSS